MATDVVLTTGLLAKRTGSGIDGDAGEEADRALKTSGSKQASQVRLLLAEDAGDRSETTSLLSLAQMPPWRAHGRPARGKAPVQ
jgi:hypothetical protein